MSFLYIGSTGDYAGHSLITWAIARRLVEKGLRVGFLKPFGTQAMRVEGSQADPDVLLFKAVLNLQEPLEHICPYLDSNDAWRQKGTAEILNELKSLAHELSVEKDVVIIMGAKHIFFDDTAYPITDISFTAELKADFVLVHRYRDTAKSIYSILSISSMLKQRIKGIILNRVSPEKLEDISDGVIPSLVKKGIPVTIALPEDPTLSYRSLREIAEVLNGAVLWGEEILEQPVGGMTVGSADLKGGLKLFKRVYNKIILLGPVSLDNENQELSAPRTIAGIVLTGGRTPAPQILQAAKNANVPLLLVKDDTFGAQERLEKSAPVLSAMDEAKVNYLTGLMDDNGSLDSLIQSLGLLP